MEKPKAPEPLFADVKDCVRCGEDHDHLWFQVLTNPMFGGYDIADWTHWALCPRLGEPVLLQVTDD